MLHNDIFLPTRLQTLFWEIKNRFFYLLLSFFLSFIVSYHYSTSLLYLFVLSYKGLNDCAFIIPEKYNENILQLVLKEIGFDDLPNKLSNDENCSTISLLQKPLNKSLDCVLWSDLSISTLLYFYKVLKDVDISSISFIFTDVKEAFSSTILICLIFSFLVIIPVFIYESFIFFLPSLHIFEKQKWLLQISIITLVWYFFIYNVQKSLIPKLAEFLLKFQISDFGFSVIGQMKIYTYCVWAITIFLTTSLIFLVFCLALFCVISQKIDIESITKHRKMSRVVILLLSAIIAPPEIQLFLAIIAVSFFESAIYYFFFYKNFCKKKMLLNTS